MAQRRSHRRLIGVGIPAGIAVALSFLFTPFLFADGGDPALIHACVKKNNGQVRIVQANDTCGPSELPMHWAAGGPAAAAGGSIMVHGNGFGAGGDPVVFVHFGGGIPVYRSPRAGVIQNMRALIPANTYNGPTTVTLNVNGVATTLTFVIPPGSTGNVDVPGTVAISDGDQVSIVLDRGASTSGSLELSIAYEIE